jgi:acyl-coenzyme A thioesterase PaaI-like protein
MTRSTAQEGVEFARDYHKKVKFAAHLGIEQIVLEPGVARMACALQPHMTNSWGIAHGGVIMTIELSTAFIDGGKGTLQSEARVLRDGRSLIFVEGEVRNEDGTLVAKAQGTVRARQAKASE